MEFDEKKIETIKKILLEQFNMNVEDISSYCRIEKSKRNLVVSIRNHPKLSSIVIKLFNTVNSNKDSKINELNIYTQLSGDDFTIFNLPFEMELTVEQNIRKINSLKVPKFFGESDDYIILQYIEGINLLELVNIWVNEKNLQSFTTVFEMLIQWYSHFFNKTNLLCSDNHVQNFILQDNALYGIDFEELNHEIFSPPSKSIMNCIVSIFISIISLEPDKIFDERIDFLKLLAKNFYITLKNSSIIFNQWESYFFDLIEEKIDELIMRRMKYDRINNKDAVNLRKFGKSIISHLQNRIKN